MSSYAVRVRVVSSLVNANATAIITIPIANPSSVPVITSGASGAAVVRTPYSFQLAASGVPVPTFAVVGALPAWLKLDAGTGVLSGTPTEIGRSSFSVVATNAAGTSAAVPLTIVVVAAPIDPTTPSTGGGAGGGGAITSTGGATTPTGGSSLPGGTAGIHGSHLAETGLGETSWVSAVFASLLLGGGIVLGPIMRRRRRRAAA
nr:putative Ig domain-containing protein [Subtercola sp. Z020]